MYINIPCPYTAHPLILPPKMILAENRTSYKNAILKKVMKERVLSLILFVCLAAGVLQAQTRTVEGIVTSADDGLPVSDPDKCVYCTLCAKKCPQEAIRVDRKEKTWALDEEKCVQCGICASACPKHALSMQSI